MDSNTAQMTSSVFIPVQTVVACNYIFYTVEIAILEDSNREDTAEIGKALAAGKRMLEKVKTWPAMFKMHSKCHRSVTKTISLASSWLERSPLFDAKTVEILKQYLEEQPGFSASGLKFNKDGVLLNRDSLLLVQSLYPIDMEWDNSSWCLSDGCMLRYRKFVTQLLWARENPASRMLAPGFKGLWEEHSVQTCDKDIFQRLEGLNITDDATTAGTHTPSTTRPNSPALTERPDGTTNGESPELGTPLAPMLKYIAVIETATDKAIFNLDISDVNEKKRRLMRTAQGMCTDMVSNGYEGKAKLQDIMDMVVKMAEDVRRAKAAATVSASSALAHLSDR